MLSLNPKLDRRDRRRGRVQEARLPSGTASVEPADHRNPPHLPRAETEWSPSPASARCAPHGQGPARDTKEFLTASATVETSAHTALGRAHHTLRRKR